LELIGDYICIVCESYLQDTPGSNYSVCISGKTSD
jgi:hypothetical protein